jgi:CRISPR-associated protein Cas2
LCGENSQELRLGLKTTGKKRSKKGGAAPEAQPDEDGIPITMMGGYRIMWMLVMFDLPVIRKKDRAEATRFRKDLLDLGFDMAQYSVYMRCCVSKERVEALTKNVTASLPEGGNVAILTFTDKQYENMQHFHAKIRTENYQENAQLALF